MRDYTEIIKLAPTAEAYYNRGISYYLQEQYEKGAEDYRHACEISKWKEPQYIHALGDILLHLRKYAEALKHYERVAQFNDYMNKNGEDIRECMEACKTALAK